MVRPEETPKLAVEDVLCLRPVRSTQSYHQGEVIRQAENGRDCNYFLKFSYLEYCFDITMFFW